MIMKSFLFISEKQWTRDLQRLLTFENPDAQKQADMGVKITAEPIFTLYKRIEMNGKVWYRVPRYTLGSPEDLFAQTNDITFDVNEAKTDVDWKSPTSFNLNSAQIETIMKAMKMLQNHWGGVIVAKTGEGKTTMAIRLITLFGQKTLILVHKNALMEQWKEELLKLTNLKPKDIGILQQGEFVDGKVVIGSQASLMRGTIPDDINRHFGFVIQDEVHRIGAEMFLRSFTRFNAKYRLGLSATPHREDGLENIYFLHMGRTIIEHTSVRNVGAQYKIIQYERKKKWGYTAPWIPMKIALINSIIVDEERNKILLTNILSAIAGKRKILVLSERISHLKFLMLETAKKAKNKRLVRFFGAQSLTKKQRAEGIRQETYVDPSTDMLNLADVIFATYSKAKEGVNIPHLDTLIFATPFSSRVTLIQAKGRIERTYEGKQHPLIIDIFDEGQFLLEAMSNKRKRIYNELDAREVPA